MSRTGTIVMGLVTAGILSYALYDTLDDGSEAPSCELQHPELAMIAELRTAKQAQLATIAGTAIASPGSYLAGVQLEMPLDPAAADRLPTITRPTPEQPYQVSFTEEAGIVRAVEVTVGRYDRGYDEECEVSDDPCACEFTSDERPICMDLERRLLAAWGAGSATDGTTRTWINPTSRDRATLRDCVLTFDRAE
jgi:hypothetical protein